MDRGRMNLRFILDMGISPRVLEGLRARGCTAAHVQDIGMARASDPAIVEEARQQNAIVITTDKDLANHVAMAGASKPSVITLRLDNPAADEQVTAVEALLDALPVEALESCLITL